MTSTFSRHGASLAAACALALVAAPPSRARACPPPSCDEIVNVLPVAGDVPANLTAMLWATPGRAATRGVRTPDDVSLVMHGAPHGRGVVPLVVHAAGAGSDETVLTLGAALTPGATYELRARDFCEGRPPRTIATVHAVEASPLPSALGTLEVTPAHVAALRVATSSGACTADATAAQVELTLAPDPTAVPWLAAFRFETLLDGVPWHPESMPARRAPLGASWRGRGRDLVYAVCASTDARVERGTTAGAHTVALRVWLPGTAVTFVTAAVPIALRCP